MALFIAVQPGFQFFLEGHKATHKVSLFNDSDKQWGNNKNIRSVTSHYLFQSIFGK